MIARARRRYKVSKSQSLFTKIRRQERKCLFFQTELRMGRSAFAARARLQIQGVQNTIIVYDDEQAGAKVFFFQIEL